MNVDDSLTRWTGWVLIGYAALWVWFWTVSVRVGPGGVLGAVVTVSVFGAGYWILITAGFERILETGGFYRGGGSA